MDHEMLQSFSSKNTYGPVACAFTLSFPYHNFKGTCEYGEGNAYKLDDDRNGMHQRLGLPTYT